jgi:hypothetical protein
MPEFQRERHRLVWSVLQSLNAGLLEQSSCYFGGGTRIVLELEEYRESADLDFLCADRDGYRTLRGEVTQASFGALFTESYELLRDIRADMYGIRTYLRVEGQPIKIEIIAEGRIDLVAGDYPECPVPTLNHVSCVAEKFLANADRARDSVVRARDLIDLAFMGASWSRETLDQGLKVAQAAYGDVVLRELDFALASFEDDAYRRTCVGDLEVSDGRKLRRGLGVLRAAMDR